VKCQCHKETIENKTASVIKHFKKLTTGNNVFIVSVIVYSNSHILQVLHKIQCVCLAAERRTQGGDATDYGAINENQLFFDEVKAYVAK